MRLRFWVAGLAVAAGTSVTVGAISGRGIEEAVPPSLASAGLWKPASLVLPREGMRAPVLATIRSNPSPAPRPTALRPAALAEVSMPTIEPPFATWSRTIASGETLDAVLAEAGLAAQDRAEAALALGAEYDLRRLRPGHSLDVVWTPGGRPRRIALHVDDGVRIEAVFGARPETRVTIPDLDVVTLAGETRIATSLFASIAEAGMPARFAVDLAQMLGGTIDFRRDLSGGETLRLMWREPRIGDDLVGQPELAFAALDLGGALYEVAWPEDGTGRATIYLDGEVQRVFAQPVEGARLSSVFGRRIHPVFGNVRMHTGVDFAAPRGTPVHATAPGRIAFIGRRGGYGRVVEVAHGAETTTRYAHLSAVPDGLAVGQRVTAGDEIGRVGATGTATGPNLHYEVLVDGRPTDPLSDKRLANAADRAAQDGEALARLTEARRRLGNTIDRGVAAGTIERL